MAQYGRYRITLLNAQGQPYSGASVEIRKQGATINGDHAGTVTSFLVNDPGGVVAADQVQAGTLTSPTRTVASVAATNVTVNIGFFNLNDDDRLTVVNNLPTLYNDAQGAETKANPLTTDANGRAECWLPVRPHDVLVSGGTDPSGAAITTTLFQDEIPKGNERLISNVFAGAGPAFIFDTTRVLSTDDKIISIREAAVEKFSVDDDGDVAGGKGTFSGAVSGTTGTFSSTLGVTGAATLAGGITGPTTHTDALTINRTGTGDWAILSRDGTTWAKFTAAAQELTLDMTAAPSNSDFTLNLAPGTGGSSFRVEDSAGVGRFQVYESGLLDMFDGYFVGTERSDPAAPAGDSGALYFRDNGAGKTQLVARFSTGAVQVIATEP